MAVASWYHQPRLCSLRPHPSSPFHSNQPACAGRQALCHSVSHEKVGKQYGSGNMAILGLWKMALSPAQKGQQRQKQRTGLMAQLE